MIYSENKNPFAGKKVVNFKKDIIYPYSGSVRFQICLDKNGQVYEIQHTYANTIVDPLTKKKFTKIIIGERPKELFNRIKGRPFELACPWIDDYIDSLNTKEEN